MVLLKQVGLAVLAVGTGVAAGFCCAPFAPASPAIPAAQAAGPRSVPERRPPADRALVPTPLPAPVPVSARQETVPGGEYNHALAANGATASGGQRSELLIDGNSKTYSGSGGFAYTDWTAEPSESFVVTLKQRTPLNLISFLLWDKENCFFRYRLEVSSEREGDQWVPVANSSASHHMKRSWQSVDFETRSVWRIRLTGVYNSLNNGFQVVELQAFCRSDSTRQEPQPEF